MGDKENMEELLGHALIEQTQIMSDTYLNSTKRMCETIEKLDKGRTVLSMIILAIIFIFIVFLLILYLF